MKIVILSKKSGLYSTTRLKEEGERRGHKVLVVNPLRCYLKIDATRPQIHYNGKVLADFDAVIPRIGASDTFYGCAVTQQFAMMGVYCANASSAIERARNKLRSLQSLAQEGIGLPITGFAHSPGDIDDLIKMVGGQPLVIKLLEGTQGIGVVLAETKSAATSVIQAFMGLRANILAQQFVKESAGSDIRCFVIGNKVVAAMRRQAPPGEFRSNLHRGGIATKEKITKEERETAIRAAQINGLNIAGVDMLRSKEGPVVMEVNASPGLEGIETATKKNIAGLIIEFIERKVKHHQGKAKEALDF